MTLFGFICTGILGASLTWWLNARSHMQDVETSIRESAIGAVSDISELVNERRERGVLVISSIRRGAPEAEIVARKTAYDEAYIRWNAKVPGDLLRIRAGLRWTRSRYEKYIDGLTNANILLHATDENSLLHGQQFSPNPGLFGIMDGCLTRAFDAYRAASFTPSPQATKEWTDCKFMQVYRQSIDCFSMIAEAMYIVVNAEGASTTPVSDQQVVDACKPPETSG